MRCIFAVTLLVMGLLAVPMTVAEASLPPSGTTFVVDSKEDGIADTTNCDLGHTAGTCRLRDALAAAATGDTITFSVMGTIMLSSGSLNITSGVTIQGPGATSLAIDGGCATCGAGGAPSGGVPVFTVPTSFGTPPTPTISGLTIQHGNNQYSGGGIYMNGGGTATITVTDSIITANSAVTGGGIGIADGFTVHVSNSVISLNAAQQSGGGIYNNNGNMTVTNSVFVGNVGRVGGGINSQYGGGPRDPRTVTSSTFTGNTAQTGGAIYDSGGLTVTNSTFSGNAVSGTCGVGGGAIYASSGSFVGPFTLTNSTISGNSSPTATGIGECGTSGGGGIKLQGDPSAVTNTIIANNTGGNCIGVAPIGLNDLQFGDSSCGAGIPTQNPLLTSLGDYGSATTLPDGSHLKTFALLPGSAAIDAGDDATCGQPLPPAAPPNGAASVDERGVVRPQGVHCDIGSFESRGFALAVVEGSTPQSAIVTTAFAHPLAVALTANDPGVPVDGAVVSYAVTPAANSASATLSAPTATVSGGRASVTAQANATASAPGVSYTATATATGAPPVTFALTNLPPAITLSPATLPNGTANQAYSQQLSASGTGSTAPYTFTVTTGSLPNGLTLNGSTGVLSGTPTTAGSSTFIVTATDANNFTGTQQYTLTIGAAVAQTLVVTGPGGSANPSGKVGQTIQLTAQLTGGDAQPVTVTTQTRWSSDHPEIASVDPTTGIVTAVKGGTATITAAYPAGNPTQTQSIVVTITAPVLTGVQPAPAPQGRASGASIATGVAPGPAPGVLPSSR